MRKEVLYDHVLDRTSAVLRVDVAHVGQPLNEDDEEGWELLCSNLLINLLHHPCPFPLTAAADEAQEQVLRYYDKMYQRGYFRDSYNPSNLLWLFGLSWWRDVLDVLVGKDGKMSPRNARRSCVCLQTESRFSKRP